MPGGVYTHRRKPLTDRFWAKVDKDGPIPAHNPDIGPCWLWTGSRTPNGYGRINPGDSSTLYVHHLSYRLHVGPIPPRMDVCHHCDVRHCVAPHHLFIGTRADNMADMAAKGRGHGPGLIGSRHPQAKLTEAQVGEIKHLLNQGLRGVLIARWFGIGACAVSDIRRGATWRHVD